MGQIVKIKHYKQDSIMANNTEDYFEDYVAYWRANPHRFITDYIGGKLYGFQNIIIYSMNERLYFTFAGSRGIAKTAVSAWFAIQRAILYPDQQIVVTSYEKHQSLRLIQYIEKYSKRYPNLAKEIEKISTSVNNAYVKFYNKSKIYTVTNSEGARGERCHILIVDEFALLKSKEDIDSIFTPMMSNTRQPPFLDLMSENERRQYQELNKELYLSSIRTESEWSWQYLLQTLERMSNCDDKYHVMIIPYHYGVQAGYINEENVAKQFREHGGTSIDLIRAEYEAIPIRSDASSFYQYSNFEKVRNSTDVLVPMSDEEFVQMYNKDSLKDKRKKWQYYKEKKRNELRIMSVDIALIGGKNNDNTSIHIHRLQPNNQGYKKLLAYAETMHGRHSKEQSLRIKQLFYEMECDYVIIDAAGNGVSVVEYLMDYTEDSNRGITYDPWTVVNSDEVNLNTLNVSNVGLPVMYGIKATPEKNHAIYTNAKSMLENGEIEMPVNELDGQAFLNTHYNFYEINDNDLRRRMMSTFTQTTMLVIEATGLVTSTAGIYIKLEPKSGRRKDRFTSWAYGLWLIKRLEDEYKQSLNNTENFWNDYTIFM